MMVVRRVVLGVGIAAYPDGGIGNTWIFLNWAWAFRRLGWEVWLVEELPRNRLKGGGGLVPLAQSPHALYWRETLAAHDFRGTLVAEGEPWPEDGSPEFVGKADLFVNISGHFKRHDLMRGVKRRLYVDLDPGFTQTWEQVYGVDMNLDGHTDFATVALGWNDAEARVPRDGREWMSVPPPVDLKLWPKQPPVAGSAWTTVTHWYGYPRIEWDGLVLDNKAGEFSRVADLPRRAGVRLRIASDLQPGWEDYTLMGERGWELDSALEICRDTLSYLTFIRESAGEFSPAKGGYVVMNSGWLSDRTVCYLASGRPAVVQETGWSRHLPQGLGLASYRTLEEAVEALQRASAERDRAAVSARETAERFFDGRQVVGDLIARLG